MVLAEKVAGSMDKIYTDVAKQIIWHDAKLIIEGKAASLPATVKIGNQFYLAEVAYSREDLPLVDMYPFPISGGLAETIQKCMPARMRIEVTSPVGNQHYRFSGVKDVPASVPRFYRGAELTLPKASIDRLVRESYRVA